MSSPSGAVSAPSGALVGAVCYLLACLFWGLNIPLTATLFATFDAFWLACLRLSIATLILAVWVGLTLGPARLRPSIPWWRILVMSGCVSLFFVLYNLGLLYTNTITAAAIMAGSPVYGAVVFRVMTRAPLEKGFWGAALLTVIGAIIAIYGRAGEMGQSVALGGGELFIVLSFVAWAVYSILAVRWFPTETPQLSRTFLTSLCAIPWLLLWWMLARAAGLAGAPNLNPDPTALAYLLITAVFSTTLGNVLWNIGVARLGVNAGMMWQNTVPVFAVLISLVFFGVRPLLEQVLGGALVLGGVLYMQWNRMREQRARAG